MGVAVDGFFEGELAAGGFEAGLGEAGAEGGVAAEAQELAGAVGGVAGFVEQAVLSVLEQFGDAAGAGGEHGEGAGEAVAEDAGDDHLAAEVGLAADEAGIGPAEGDGDVGGFAVAGELDVGGEAERFGLGPQAGFVGAVADDEEAEEGELADDGGEGVEDGVEVFGGIEDAVIGQDEHVGSPVPLLAAGLAVAGAVEGGVDGVVGVADAFGGDAEAGEVGFGAGGTGEEERCAAPGAQVDAEEEGAEGAAEGAFGEILLDEQVGDGHGDSVAEEEAADGQDEREGFVDVDVADAGEAAGEGDPGNEGDPQQGLDGLVGVAAAADADGNLDDAGVAADGVGDGGFFAAGEADVDDVEAGGEAFDDGGQGVEQFGVFRRAIAEPEGQAGLARRTVVRRGVHVRNGATIGCSRANVHDMQQEMNTNRSWIGIGAGAALAAVLAGCGGAGREPAAEWLDFLGQTAETARFACVAPERTGFISTSDPAGGNNDYNNFVGPSREAGWVVLADLKGPGVLDRFWFTGIDAGYPMRFYFDGEKTPRIEGAVDELFGAAREPFVPPFAQWINQCWWSYVPLTFAKSLRIEGPQPPVHPYWGQRRLYVQANSRHFDRPVQTFPARLPEGYAERAAAAAQAWDDSLRTDFPIEFSGTPVAVPAGEEVAFFEAEGPATIPQWAIRVRAPGESLPASARNALLQQAVLQIYYDGMAEPSASVPLGDFFCNAWRKRNLANLALASVDDGYVFRMPTPFGRFLRMALLNRSPRELEVDFLPGAPEARAEGQGYFHAVWSKSGPEQKGRPHVLAGIEGKGKYVGCFLGVTSEDKSWWILEGDDVMRVDGRKIEGTGLEDYFNGGWYYRGCSFAPLSGILDRYPFRTAQYRFHLNDPVHFSREFRLSFERGDQNVSAGTMRGTAYFYMESPRPVPNAAHRTDLAAEANPFENLSLMLQIFELERARDYRACLRQIDEWLETNAHAEHAGVLRLRQLEYRRLLDGGLPEDAYAPFIEGLHGETAKQQASLLQWFYAATNRYLVGAVNNAAGEVRLNGQAVLTEFHPLALAVRGVELPPGEHVLEIHATPVRAIPWVQTGIRGHGGLAGTGPGCRATRRGGAEEERTGPMDVMRGPPQDEQYVGAEPNAFVLLQSEIYGIRASNWDARHDPARFEIRFRTDELEPSPFGRAVVGLPPSR